MSIDKRQTPHFCGKHDKCSPIYCGQRRDASSPSGDGRKTEELRRKPTLRSTSEKVEDERYRRRQAELDTEGGRDENRRHGGKAAIFSVSTLREESRFPTRVLDRRGNSTEWMHQDGTESKTYRVLGVPVYKHEREVHKTMWHKDSTGATGRPPAYSGRNEQWTDTQ